MDTIGGDPGASLLSGDFASRLDAFDQLIGKAGGRFPLLGRLLHHANVNGRGLLLALLALLLLLVLPPLAERLHRRAGHLQTNFRGEAIPQSMGLAILLYAFILFVAVDYFIPAAQPEVVTWLLAIVGFGTLGFADDRFGNRQIRGLRGHFRAAFRERTITTGFVKAIGGAALALLLGFRLHPNSPPFALLAAAIIALAANAINLMDLRPGRAGGVFLALALPLLYAGWRVGSIVGVPFLLFVFMPTLRVWERDAKAQVMLGDAGSNLLGATLGLALVESPASPVLLVFVLCGLLALHVLAERASLTALIEKTPMLRFFDRMTGVR